MIYSYLHPHKPEPLEVPIYLWTSQFTLMELQKHKVDIHKCEVKIENTFNTEPSSRQKEELLQSAEVWMNLQDKWEAGSLGRVWLCIMGVGGHGEQQ